MSCAISYKNVVADIWKLAAGDPAALDYLDLEGSDPVLPSSFRGGCAAQASIAVAALSAAELRHKAGPVNRSVWTCGTQQSSSAVSSTSVSMANLPRLMGTNFLVFTERVTIDSYAST